MYQCAFYWGSEPCEGGGNFTLQPGTAPSQGMFRLPMRAGTPQIADLRMSTGQSTRILRNCRIQRAVVTEANGGGRWREITVLDKRWMWEGGIYAVYGTYNTLLPRQKATDTSRAKSARQLAAILLDAMGEVMYDVQSLPDEAYPPVDWDAANPAMELSQLCDMFGCVVTLTPDDRVIIHRQGVGQVPRPDPRQMDFNQSIEPPVIPKALVFEGGRTHIQHDLPIEPVAWEPDKDSKNYGTYVPIDQVSYKPAGGWQGEDPMVFGGVDPALRKLALRDVYRLYMVRGDFQLPSPMEQLSNGAEKGKLGLESIKKSREFFKITDATGWRILPLNKFTNRPAENNGDPQVLGYFALLNNANTNNTAATAYAQLPAVAFDASKWIQPVQPDPATIYAGQYQIDDALGMVVFDEPCYFRDNISGIQPAVVRLRISFPIRYSDTGAFMCQQYWVYPGSRDAVNVPKIIKNSEVQLKYDLETDDAAENDMFLRPALEHLQQELRQYEMPTGYSAPYRGFVFDIPVDGVVKALVYDVAESGEGTTHIDYGMERPDQYLTLAEVRARRMTTYLHWLQAESQRKIRNALGKNAPKNGGP